MFQFKKFTIHQDQCAMKVTEIACLQGAWTPIPTSAKTVLDIGSGTGLLSLMLAQRFPNLELDAIEIDEQSFIQGKENIEASPFSSQINCINGDVTQYPFSKKYDFIIINPPFFENQLKSPDVIKNKAWHSTELTLDKLIEVIKNNLSEGGMCSIIYPVERVAEFLMYLVKYDLFSGLKLYIFPNENKTAKYFISMFSNQELETIIDEILIKEKGVYSERANTLFKDFYLK